MLNEFDIDDILNDMQSIMDSRKKRNSDQHKKYLSNPTKREMKRIKAKEWRVNNPEKQKLLSRKNKLKNKYKVDICEVEKAIIKQAGKCKICNKEAKLEVDHCHTTNKFRGLLCRKCNFGMGYIDKEEWIKLALEYKYAQA